MTDSRRPALYRALWITVAVLAGAVTAWFQLIQNFVPAPYLDEVFHVRQATNYVKGNWNLWDPKITTPPGLYLVSSVYIKFSQIIGLLPQEITGPGSFRVINVIGSLLLAWTVQNLLLLSKDSDGPEERTKDPKSWGSAELVHNVINICLFPPLFFFYDYIKLGISYGIVGVVHPYDVVLSITPYLVTLIGFIQFVIWNGGVVLGDKENHVISLHFAQMLYIWPYITFFSIPLLYPYFLSIPQKTLVIKILPINLKDSALLQKSIKRRLPGYRIILPILAIMLAIVRYNTIIHPFTLADNRHYTFYVFRLLLRRPYIRYLVVPIYFLCAWAVITALGGAAPETSQLSQRKRGKQPDYRAASEPQQPPSGPRASFLLLWLICTALSVVTAPLVEPRYFIVPWLIWRIHIADGLRTGSDESDGRSSGYDHRLWLETVWFVIINATIGYIFLFRGFEWPQEPGLVQRFMW